MSTRDLALSAAVSREATKDPIKNMSRAQAIQYCLDNKLPMALAVGVGDNVMLQKQKAQMMAMQQPSKPPVLEANHQQAVQQYTADQARQGGIADLPVDPSLYSFSKPGMKAGGIVAFTPDQPGNQGQLVNADSSGAVRPFPMAGTDTDLATYVRSYMGEDNFDRLNPVDKSNVLKSLAPKYNEQHQAAMNRANAQPLLDASKNAAWVADAPYVAPKPPTVAAPAPTAPKPPTVAAPAPAAPKPPTVAAPAPAPAPAAPKPPTVAAPAPDPVSKPPVAAAPAATSAPPSKPKQTTVRGALTDAAHNMDPEAAPIALDTSASMKFTLPKDSPPWMKSLYNDYNNAAALLNKETKDYDPGNPDAFISNLSDLNNPRNKGTKDFLDNLSTQSADALKQKDQAKWLALINFGSGVMKSSPHLGLVAALTSGAENTGPQYLKDLANARTAQNEVSKNEYLAQQHLQDGALNAYEKQVAKYEVSLDREHQMHTKFLDTTGQILGQLAHATITAKPYYEPVESRIWSELGRTHPDMTTEQKIALMPRGFAATTGAGARVTASEIAAASAALKNLTGGSDTRQFPTSPGHDQWQQEYDHWSRIAQSGGGGGGGNRVRVDLQGNVVDQ